VGWGNITPPLLYNTVHKFTVLSSFTKMGFKHFRVLLIFRTRASFIFGSNSWALMSKVETRVESVREPDAEEHIWAQKIRTNSRICKTE
jgi:hypothetical protein